MRKRVKPAMLVLLLLALAGPLSGCDQVKDLATQAGEEAKKEIVKEVGKAISGETPEKQEGEKEKEEKEK